MLIGLLILVLDVWAILSIVGSSAALLAKVLWTLLVLVFPIGGFILWYFFGPRG